MRTAVMEGSLADFDLPSVIQVVSIGRQYTGVELFDDLGGSVGTLLLKSGKILAATSGPLSGIDAVFTLLRGRGQKRFSVYRTEPLVDVKSPVGSVGEVLLSVLQNEMKAPTRISVMEGSLAEFDLVSVLQVIGIGRQFTGVEVLDPGGKLLGRIEVKAGKVLSASTGHLRGFDSIRRLVQSPRNSRFLVYRSSEEAGESHIGSLSSMLMKLVDPDDQWDVAEPHTRTARAVVSAAAKPSEQPPPVSSVKPPPSPPSVQPAAPGPSAKTPVEAKRERTEETRSPFIGDAYTSPRGMVALPPDEVPVICVTSPKGGAGKTTVALNLSVALARRGKRVVLVDSDFGGVLLALNAQAKSGPGAYDVLAGKARLGDVIIKTRIPHLRIVPSGDSANAALASKKSWQRLLHDAKGEAEIVVVDLAAGMNGAPAEVCAACTHALVVLAAEPASLRALPGHLRLIEAVASPAPKLAGIVLNMLDYRVKASLEVLKDLCAGPSAPWTFDVPIARSPAFMEAVARGLPLCRGEHTDTPTIGWVFEMLASGILERLGIGMPAFEDAPLL